MKCRDRNEFIRAFVVNVLKYYKMCLFNLTPTSRIKKWLLWCV